MLARTHTAFGFLSGLALAPLAAPASLPLFVGISTFTSLFPDVDHPEAKIHHYLKFTRIIPRFVEHRGIFHSIWIGGLGTLGLYFVAPWVGMAFGVGYLSHLVGDSLTKEGVNYLSPLAQLRIAGPINTGGIAEHVLLIAIVAASIAKLVL